MKENKDKTRTNEIEYENFDMAEYLKRNTNESVTKYIFKVRSGTLELKKWSQWKYEDNLCIGCELKEETMSHFMECEVYNVNKNSSESVNWKNIYKNNMEQQIIIAKEVERRFNMREEIIQEAGRDSQPQLPAPGQFV